MSQGVSIGMEKALVTGANKGLGFEIARGLGLRGYEVWVMRRMIIRFGRTWSVFVAVGAPVCQELTAKCLNDRKKNGRIYQ